MINKDSNGKLSFALVVFLAFLLFTTTVSAATTFNDLGKVKWAEDKIYYLSDKGIISGYGNGLFGPSDKITREQAASMLVRSLYPNEVASKNPSFDDVSKDDFYYNVISVASEKGLISGYTDNTFRGDSYITRAETAVMIDKAYKVNRSKSSTKFKDVEEGKWFTNGILDLASNKIINGYTDGTFKPSSNITRAEFSVVLSLAVEPDFRPSTEELEVHFIDVGQGDSTLIITESGKTMLIDGGKKSAGDKVTSYLTAQGIKKVDWMVATHPDADHIGGLIDVLEQFKVGKVLDSGKSHTTDTYMEYLTLIDEKDIPFEVAEEGSYINFDNQIKVQVLNALDASDDMNESSVVLKMTQGTVDFLLTGDASVENEEDMIRDYNVEAEILKVGHHGSDTSTSQALVNEVSPDAAVLSYGENNYGHPDTYVVNRLRNAGADLYSTYESGDIVVTTNGKTFNVSASPWQGEIIEPTPEPEEPEVTFPININTADYETLQHIPGVGESIAQYIIDYRNANGPFQSVTELDNVDRIGPAAIEKMRPHITL